MPRGRRTIDGGASERLAAVLARYTGHAPCVVDLVPLTGGLVSPSVQAVRARYRDSRGVRRITELVVKQLHGPTRREATVYQALMRSAARRMAPALLAVEPGDEGCLQLFLQHIAPENRWPWQEVTAVGSVLSALAILHEAPAASALVPHVSDWDYELELQRQGARLVACLEEHRVALRAAGVEPRLALARRLGQRLPALRRQLLRQAALPLTVIHGDVHPGNVMLLGRASRTPGEHNPVLIDWARARLGSPLEDVSSWLQSLGYWEPVARRRHDTLLGQYLRARGLRGHPSPELRDAYWVAAASNCFAGSLEYHVRIATHSEGCHHERMTAVRAVRDQLRILRRADACSR